MPTPDQIAAMPPRKWRIRRTPTGQWAIHMRTWYHTCGDIYVLMSTQETWDDAGGYVQRTHANNYPNGEAA